MNKVVVIGTRTRGADESPLPVTDFHHAVAAEMVSRGYDVHMFYRGRVPNAKEKAWLTSKCIQWDAPWLDIGSSTPLILSLVRTLSVLKPHLAEWHFGFNGPGILASRITQVPSIVVWHHTVFNLDTQTAISKYVMRLRMLRSGLIRRLATHHVANSLESASYYRRMYALGNKNVRVFSVGLEVGELTDRDAEHCMPCILCVSLIRRSKGQSVLVEAASILTYRGYKFDVTFVGDGERSWLEGVIDHHGMRAVCTLAGLKSRKEVYKYYRRATIAVFPTQAEALGLVGIEAMACGAPLVASDLPAIREYVQDGETGLLFRTGDATDLADKIQLLLENPALREKLSVAARASVEDRLMPNAARVYCDFLETCIQETTPS